MPILTIIALAILIPLFLASIVASFFFYRKFMWKKLAEKIEIMYFGIERQKYLELQTLLKRLTKSKKAQHFISTIQQQYAQIQNLRGELSDDIGILQQDLKHKKLDKQFFDKSWKKHLNLEILIKTFKIDVAAIFEKMDLNLAEYKKITLDLPEAIKIKDQKYRKFQITNDILDLKLSFVAMKNKNLKESLNDENYESNQIALNELKTEILSLYMFINDFVEISAQLNRITPKLILNTKEKMVTKIVKEASLQKIGIEDLIIQMEQNYDYAQSFFQKGDTEKAKEQIREIYIKVEIIEQKIKEEIYYINFVKANKQLITDCMNKVNATYKEIKNKLVNYNATNFIAKNINLVHYASQIQTIYNVIVQNWKLALSQKTKKEFSLTYQELTFKIKNMLTIINELELKVFELNKQKQHQRQMLPRLEMTMLNLEELILDENIILLPKSELLLNNIKQLQSQLVQNNNFQEDNLIVNNALLENYQKQIIDFLNLVGKDIEVKKVCKIILQELNAQRSSSKELNGNLKLMEKNLLDGHYQKALKQFIEYLKRRK